MLYRIRRDIARPDDGENKDFHIICNSSLVGNMFTRDSRQVLDILK